MALAEPNRQAGLPCLLQRPGPFPMARNAGRAGAALARRTCACIHMDMCVCVPLHPTHLFSSPEGLGWDRSGPWAAPRALERGRAETRHPGAMNHCFQRDVSPHPRLHRGVLDVSYVYGPGKQHT